MQMAFVDQILINPCFFLGKGGGGVFLKVERFISPLETCINNNSCNIDTTLQFMVNPNGIFLSLDSMSPRKYEKIFHLDSAWQNTMNSCEPCEMSEINCFDSPISIDERGKTNEKRKSKRTPNSIFEIIFPVRFISANFDCVKHPHAHA